MAHRSLADLLAEHHAVPLAAALALGSAGHPLARRLVVEEHLGDHARFLCRCGRDVLADEMLDLDPPHVPAAHTLTAAERTALGVGGDRFRCTGCSTRWVLSGDIDPDRLREATGQPPRSGAHKTW